MATPKQQNAWWALVKDDEAYAPTGQRLKDWLFGGTHIPTSNALFDVDASGLAVVSDLFGDDSYFADANGFWEAQSTAIAETVEQLRGDGWADVVVLETGSYFARWDHRTCPKDDNGHVFFEVSHQGEVTIHEGYITGNEAKRRDKAKAGSALQSKPELTKAAQNYVDLHRHAAVRADLLSHSNKALRLIAAHMIAGSSLWQVQADPQKAAKEEIAESLSRNAGVERLDEEREAVAELLGLPAGTAPLDQPACYEPRLCIADVFGKLMTLADDDVLRILTFLMADSLSVHSPLIDTLAHSMGTGMTQHWQPEDTLFDLIRDKQVLNAMISEVAGESVAKGSLTETAKTQRQILSDCFNGTRTPTDANWMPRYMAFPQGSYRAIADDADASDCQDHASQREAA